MGIFDDDNVETSMRKWVEGKWGNVQDYRFFFKFWF